MNYTKGKWKTNDVGFAKCTSYRGKRTGGRAFVVDDKLGMIAECEGNTQEEAEANAQLIAQSPRMAKFLENLCAEFEDYGKIDDTFYCRAKDILTKVED